MAARKIAVVGSGPAGMYSVDALLKHVAGAQVHVFDALPTPFGLVRFGVAPDHPEVKLVTNKFDSLLQHPQVRFHGNVCVGGSARDDHGPNPNPAAVHVPLDTIRRHFDAVLLACGASEDVPLGVPGADGPRCLPASRFVGWYNGHPQHAACKPDLSHHTAVVIGQGNVALDVARILLRPVADLQPTDITTDALSMLQTSNVRNVYLVGRRGPVQAAFTTAEIREMFSLMPCSFEPADFDLNPASKEEAAGSRATKRKLDLLTKQLAASQSQQPQGDRMLHLRFFLSPTEIILPADGVGPVKVNFVRNELQGEAGRQRTVPTGTTVQLEAGVVFSAIGYRAAPFPGLPYDATRGVVQNVDGRVCARETAPHRAPVYVAGWLKRGATGIVGSNIMDAQVSVALLAEDLQGAHADEVGTASTGGLDALLRDVPALGDAGRVVDVGGWQRIDRFEQEEGERRGRSREKLVHVERMLQVARGL